MAAPTQGAAAPATPVLRCQGASNGAGGTIPRHRGSDRAHSRAWRERVAAVRRCRLASRADALVSPGAVGYSCVVRVAASAGASIGPASDGVSVIAAIRGTAGVPAFAIRTAATSASVWVGMGIGTWTEAGAVSPGASLASPCGIAVGACCPATTTMRITALAAFTATPDRGCRSCRSR